MRHLKEGDFSERRKTALEAKKQLLEKLKNAPKPDDPEMVAKRAERAAIAAAREERRAERERLAREEAERLKAEAAAQAEAERLRKEAEEREEADRLIAEEAAKKAERDRRYAARKMRKR